MEVQPLSEWMGHYSGYMPENTKKILWRNVSALMDAQWGKENLTRLAREADFGPATSTRLKEQKTAVGLDVLEKLSKVFRLKPWQLLVPAFDPSRPPQSIPMSAQAADAARILDAIDDEDRRVKAHAIFVQLVELGAQAQPSSEPKKTPQKPR